MPDFYLLVQSFLAWLSLPEVGLWGVFFISFVSATLLPMGSEPAVYALVSYSPDLFWEAVLVATVGNTLGGVVDYWMGYAANKAVHPKAPIKAFVWLERFGAKTCLLSWLPVIGDPLCAVAGWLKLPFWPCVMYMAIGKFLRYVTMTALLMWAIDLQAVVKWLGF